MGAESVIRMLGDKLNTENGPAIVGIEPLQVLDRRVSMLLHCRIRKEDGQEMLVWAKALRPSNLPGIMERRIIRDFALVTRLYDAFPPEGCFRVPRPVFHSPEHRLIVTEHVPGRVLQAEIESMARGRATNSDLRRLEEACRLTGRWLKEFQSVTAGYCPGQDWGLSPMKVKGAARIVEQTTARLEKLSERNPRWMSASVREAVAVSLRENLDQCAEVSDPDVCAVHGDFFAGNVMIDGERAIGLDFESSTWGSGYFDPSYFMFQLETLQSKWPFRKPVISRVANAFLEGYGMDTVHGDFWNCLPVLRILFLCHSVSRLLSLADSSGGISPRSLYRRMLANRLVGRIETHIRGQ